MEDEKDTKGGQNETIKPIELTSAQNGLYSDDKFTLPQYPVIAFVTADGKCEKFLGGKP